MNIAKLRNRPKLFCRLVGLSVEEFSMLLAQVETVYPEVQHARLSRRPASQARQRAVGGGAVFRLSLEQRLVATLLYFRLGVTEALLSVLFDLDQSSLCRERNGRMRPTLEQVLPLPMQDHLLSSLEDNGNNGSSSSNNGSNGSNGSNGNNGSNRRKRISTLEELLRQYPELREICIDATEQEIPKPQDKKKSKTHFSGKSHCHTVKTQLTTAGRLVLHTLGGCPGNVADRFVCKASGVLRALNQAGAAQGAAQGAAAKRRVRLDRGYSGLDQEYGHLEGVDILAALKGSGKKKVTALGKAWNAAIVSPLRMQVEQNIGHLKNWRVLSGVYRCDLENHAATLALVAGLHNFRILGALGWQK